jgi:hypothetical protein
MGKLAISALQKRKGESEELTNNQPKKLVNTISLLF